jgi:hypothetical protein
MDELTGEQLASMFSSLQKLDLRANQLSDGAVSKFAQAFRYVQKSVVKLERAIILVDFLKHLNIFLLKGKEI